MVYKVKWRDKELEKMVENVAKQAIKKGCYLVEDTTKKSMKNTALDIRGMEKRVKRGKKYHYPSAPGQPPAVDSAGLITSVTNEQEGLVGRVGSNKEYARRIALGFIGIDSLGRRYHQKPRPYLRPALEKNRSKILGLFKDLIK